MNRRAYKFRLYPTRKQSRALDRSLDLCRDLYNAALQERKEAWKLQRANVSFFDQSKQISDVRRLNSDYLQIQYRVCTQVLRRVDRTFQAFFHRVKSGQTPGFPRFKGHSFFNSFCYNAKGFTLKSDTIRLANIGHVKIKQHRAIAGNVKEVVVKRECSKWYVILSCDNVPVPVIDPTNQAIGIDVGIEAFATLSDGTQIDNWKYYETTQKALRVAQRRIARRKKGSKRRRKAVEICRKIHQKIFNRRHDFQHQLSTDLIRQYDLIAVEKLNVHGMSKGILSKQIHDASWSSFFDKLRYKAESAGKEVVEVAPEFTSQDCSNCGNRVKKDLSIREHHCSVCGLRLHRDHNAALNILRAGLALKDVTYRATDSVSLEACS